MTNTLDKANGGKIWVPDTQHASTGTGGRPFFMPHLITGLVLAALALIAIVTLATELGTVETVKGTSTVISKVPNMGTLGLLLFLIAPLGAVGYMFLANTGHILSSRPYLTRSTGSTIVEFMFGCLITTGITSVVLAVVLTSTNNISLTFKDDVQVGTVTLDTDKTSTFEDNKTGEKIAMTHKISYSQKPFWTERKRVFSSEKHANHLEGATESKLYKTEDSRYIIINEDGTTQEMVPKEEANNEHNR